MTDAFQLPAYLQARDSRRLVDQLIKSLPTGSVPYLSIKGGAFTLIDAVGNERKVGAMDTSRPTPLGLYIDLCVIDSNPHVSKVYYEKRYDPNAETFIAPDCFSDNGIAPSANAQKPQHKDCKTCPHNEWGTGTGLTAKGKACQDKQKIAVVVPGMGEMAFLLSVPPKSLKHLAKYVQELGSFSAGGRKVDITDVITRIFFQPGQVGELGFIASGFVDKATAAIADKLYEGKLTDTLVGKNDQPYTGEIGVLPAAGQVQGHALPPPAPVEEPFRTALTSGTLSQGSAPAEPQKRRGRPKKEETQAPPPAPAQAPFAAGMERGVAGLQGNGVEAEGVPPFLQRAPEPPAAKPTPAFGMQSPAAAPDDMQARIAAVLAMKTGG